MTGEDLDAALKEVRRTHTMVDQRAVTLAELLVGRLRTVSQNYSGASAVRKLKAELSRFNARTGKWKD